MGGGGTEVPFSRSLCYFQDGASGIPFRRIHRAALFNIKRHFCGPTGAGPLSKVKRSRTKLILDPQRQPSVVVVVGGGFNRSRASAPLLLTRNQKL